ncbi:hypothetical protein COCC4DRAFT_20941 [Bipolaris maydis ATCC 48331]|uniref:Uncharacterized protein n=1 Tax=Cochliobolus heterostrophus (strain C4 / ATCC 48331 / race T) TaxID=665024 RepID=N4XHN2_COCH4|nr:uncharacterized protein COCC4DRAFT_20941 [Bipolaris maydis ATCC 48331]ENI08048.1 hypothetical protein COCC4DRAFT_20941 [Bipolaris maydis ATCC 48331]
MSQTLPTWSIDEDIYKGFWINQSLGKVRGATLTLDLQAGGLIIAFLALFIAATARSVWKVTRFLVYANESTLGKQDGVYHQRQAILRNQSLALDAVLDLCRLSYAWRGRAKGSQQRILPVILIASAISVVSIAAGIFSSRILTNSNQEVLIAGRHCGMYSNPIDQGSSYGPAMLYLSQKSVDAFRYAMHCYHGGSTVQNKLCETFIRPTLPFTSDRNASCPFSGGICKSDVGNILLDSGVLHSQIHLGFNQNPQFTLRHRTHCAPLKTDGFTGTVVNPNNSQTRQVYRYGNKHGSGGNADYIFAVDVRHEKPSLELSAYGNYKVTAMVAYGFIRSIEFIPELQKPDGAVSLVFLDASEILYVNKTEDPWFSATTPFDNSLAISMDGPGFFIANEPVGVIGCVTQRLYCNPTLPENVGCIDGFAISNRQSWWDLFKSAWPDANDRSAMNAFVYALGTQAMLDDYYFMPSLPTLLSRSTVQGNLQLAVIPKDRWQDEREYLYNASLAAIQSMMVEHARGLDFGMGTYCERERECRRICRSQLRLQKMRSPNHYSFSAWTLGVILIVGSTLMLISTFMEELFALLLRYPRLRSAKLTYSYCEWQAGSTLQLQRLAHENLGLGTWTRTDEAIPVTEPGDTLGVLEITDSKHVHMVIPTEELSKVDSAADSARINLLDHRVVY